MAKSRGVKFIHGKVKKIDALQGCGSTKTVTVRMDDGSSASFCPPLGGRHRARSSDVGLRGSTHSGHIKVLSS